MKAEVHAIVTAVNELTRQMSIDDLVTRLRKGGSYEVNMVVMEEAACCIEELEQLFDLRWAADMRAIKAWQIAHPDQPKTWPDHADLGTWCLSRIEALEAALREIVYTEPEDKYWPGRIARKALEGKDD